MIEYLAMRWHHLDQANYSRPQAWADCSDNDKETIRNRVWKILNRELPLHEYLEADKLVSIPHFRDEGDVRRTEAYIRERLTYWNDEKEKELPVDKDAPGVINWQPLWDCLVAPHSKNGIIYPEIQQSTRLFGNANVGRMEHTNLQVGGQLAQDQSYFATHWYCRLFVDKENSGLIDRALHSSFATFVVGHMPQAQISLHDLFYSRLQIDQSVPVRQNFSVEVNFFDRAHEVLNEHLKSPLWIVLDGAQYRFVC